MMKFIMNKLFTTDNFPQPVAVIGKFSISKFDVGRLILFTLLDKLIESLSLSRDRSLTIFRGLYSGCTMISLTSCLLPSDPRLFKSVMPTTTVKGSPNLIF